jgi:hypothetical protein
MKTKLFFIFLLFTFSFYLSSAQVPQSFNYQAIVRAASGDIIPSRAVSFRLSIIEGSVSGPSVYTETHLTTTDAFGLVHLQIGNGTKISGDFAVIDWNSHDFFLKTEIDINAGSSFIFMGTSQLISVPYSLFSQTSAKTIDKQTIEEVLKKGNDANFQKANNLIIGNCGKCDSTTKGCIQYDTIYKKLQVCNGKEWIDLITISSGLPANAVFVSPYGKDTAGYGTIKNPCRSITYGIGAAVAQGKPSVLVANGLYNETVYIVNGISLLGGYDPVTWNRNLAGSFTMISGKDFLNNHPVSISANNITQGTLIQGFVIYGKDAVIPGNNSYAVYINGSNASLNFSDNTIYCGKGSPGEDGILGISGVIGVAGGGRDLNPAGYDAFITTSSPCAISNNRQYNNGGVLNFSGDNISGGKGGGNKCPPVSGSESSGIDGSNGLSGSGPNDGAGGSGGDAGDDGSISSGICSLPGSPMTGMAGYNGLDGSNGTTGSGGLINSASIINGHWAGVSGYFGGDGGNGGGGAGGGAGGGSKCLSGCSTSDRIGGHGGGGGSGGGGGAGGTGGKSGGGSFGIFIINSIAPGIKNTAFFLGTGGDGGSGGAGGAGSPGGIGGAGGLCSGSCFCFSSAGNGGKGGNGGHAGGGGGGTGGSAIGIFTYSTTGSPDYLNGTLKNTFSGGRAGTGGYGGISYGNYGGSGQDGKLLSCSYN